MLLIFPDDLINHVVEKFPFKIKKIRTDDGYEFQAKFHWHCEDFGLEHVYIKPASPNLNGKVERSHLTDKQEFYQLINYKGDVDLEKNWQNGKHFTTITDPMQISKEKHPMKFL